MSDKYGVVYTPDNLAIFVAKLLDIESKKDQREIKTILDPACGEGALLTASKKIFGQGPKYIGIDVDKDIKERIDDEYQISINDTIVPNRVSNKSSEYWRRKLGPVDAIIANPPWSSEKRYEKSQLSKLGFRFIDGQYDSYVLFIELSLKLIVDDGYCAFIIPDSFFEEQNKKLRKHLLDNTQIRVIARLGEKIFEGVNRATTVIVCKKTQPNDSSELNCFRLDTNNRKQVLEDKYNLIDLYNSNLHKVKQSRFLKNKDYNFNIDLLASQEKLIDSIKQHNIDWNTEMEFGRGVEISKKGEIIICPSCKSGQTYSKQKAKITCKTCNKQIIIKNNQKDIISCQQSEKTKPIFVGENIHRYRSKVEKYIEVGIKGINYKEDDLYGVTKILVRKTGLGINATIDYDKALTTQTVFILSSINQTAPLEYYLALLNSRTVFFYYLTMYGENEWKSHPYLTKAILFDLPIKRYEGNDLDQRIVRLCKDLTKEYTRDKDKEIEKLIVEKYGLNSQQVKTIYQTINKMPDLSAINDMKMEGF